MPHGVLAGIGGEGEAEGLDGRVGQRFRRRSEIVPSPVRRGIRQPGVVEQILVVHDGQVVHERRDPQDPPVHRGRLALPGAAASWGMDEPYWYVTSGGSPAWRATVSFARALSLL